LGLLVAVDRTQAALAGAGDRLGGQLRDDRTAHWPQRLKSTARCGVMAGYLDSRWRTLTILFAGGGTAGTCSLRLAIAEQVLERAPTTRVRFLCSDRVLDAEILALKRSRGGRRSFFRSRRSRSGHAR